LSFTIKFILVWVFIVGPPLWYHVIIPSHYWVSRSNEFWFGFSL
jgi:hypothetical protein